MANASARSPTAATANVVGHPARPASATSTPPAKTSAARYAETRTPFATPSSPGTSSSIVYASIATSCVAAGRGNARRATTRRAGAGAAATKGVAIDAYTIELLVPGEEGVANGVRVSAYRAALVFAGGVLVALAGRAGWPTTFAVAAVGLLALAFAIGRSPLTDHHPQPPRVWARSLQAWVSRPGAIPVFLFVLLYKLDTNAIGPMVKPFWVDRGLGLDEIAFVSTTLGVGASVVGALVGGALTSRWGIFRALWVLGLFQAVANLGYAAAAWSHAGRAGIYAASLGESFGAGLGTAAFLAFLMNV